MTPSANLNPVNLIQTPPAGRKQSESASADTPFSRVLSNEIAQKQPARESRNEPKAEARKSPQSSKEAAPPATEKADTPVKADTPAKEANTTEPTTRDPLEPALADGQAPQPDPLLLAADTLPLVAETVTPLPDARLTLPIVPPPPPPADGVTDMPETLAAGRAVPLDPLQGKAPPAVQPDALKDAALAEAKNPAAQLSTKPDFQASMTATAAAAALPGQIAAAMSGDNLKKMGGLPEGLTSPLMAPTPHALLNTVSVPASAASQALAPSVGSTAWGQALGEKIVWMAAGAQQTATLTLNPPNLGPLQVVLNVNNDQATASFFAAQPEVRQALEAALPKLREMMNEAGIQLGQASVGAEQQQQNEAANREARRTTSTYPGASDGIDSGNPIQPTQIRQSGRGLVDTFA